MKKGFFTVGFLFLLCCIGCNKEEELSGCEKITQELSANLFGVYRFAAAYRSESNVVIASDSDVVFKADGNFFQLEDVRLNLCELKWYRVIENGSDRELLLYF